MESDNTSALPARSVPDDLGPETFAHQLSPSCRRPATFIRLLEIQDQAVSKVNVTLASS